MSAPMWWSWTARWRWSRTALRRPRSRLSRSFRAEGAARGAGHDRLAAALDPVSVAGGGAPEPARRLTPDDREAEPAGARGGDAGVGGDQGGAVAAGLQAAAA